MKILKQEDSLCLNLIFFISLFVAIITIIFHLKFFFLPSIFILLGLISYLKSKKISLYVFLFLFPFINSLPDIISDGYPYNYIGIALFYLSGIIIASFFKREKHFIDIPWVKPYTVFLVFLLISAIFVFLRWSNLTVSLTAFLKDTPITPSGERVSFGFIFPVITLFLFSASPYLYSLLRQNKIGKAQIIKAIILGYTISFGFALIQKFLDPEFLSRIVLIKINHHNIDFLNLNPLTSPVGFFMLIKFISTKWVPVNQFNGGSSDFNAFGLFSGIIFLLLTVQIVNIFFNSQKTKSSENNNAALKTSSKKDLFIYFPVLMSALFGIILSGSRVAFIFMVISGLYFLISKKIKIKFKVISILIIMLVILISGGLLKKRIYGSFEKFLKIKNFKEFFYTLDKVSNGRITMLKFSSEIAREFPFSGVGTGNFLFFLKKSHFNKKFLEDLPLNHYLLIFNEGGIFTITAFLIFLFFLFRGFRKNPYQILLYSILIALLVNNYFWFPEITIFFWIIIYFSDPPIRYTKKIKSMATRILFSSALILFVFFNIRNFNTLHPLDWAKKTRTPYNYGFWYQEKNPRGEIFFWTKGSSGIHIPSHPTGKFKIFAGAPFQYMKEKKQQVKLYWNGKHFKTITFKQNKFIFFEIPNGGDGFLEIQTSPTFNLKKINPQMKESRDLGVQFFPGDWTTAKQ